LAGSSLVHVLGILVGAGLLEFSFVLFELSLIGYGIASSITLLVTKVGVLLVAVFVDNEFFNVSQRLLLVVLAFFQLFDHCLAVVANKFLVYLTVFVLQLVFKVFGQRA